MKKFGIIFIFLIIFGGGLVGVLLVNKYNKNSNTYTPNTQKGNNSSVSKETGNTSVVDLNSSDILGTTFISVASGEITVQREGITETIALNNEEIAVQCTTQPLSSAESFDFDNVTTVLVKSPSELSTFIPEDEPVVLFTEEKDIKRVHTIALSSDVCESSQ